MTAPWSWAGSAVVGGCEEEPGAAAVEGPRDGAPLVPAGEADAAARATWSASTTPSTAVTSVTPSTRSEAAQAAHRLAWAAA